MQHEKHHPLFFCLFLILFLNLLTSCSKPVLDIIPEPPQETPLEPLINESTPPQPKPSEPEWIEDLKGLLVINSPQEGELITRNQQDYFFDLPKPLDIATCTLLVDGDELRTFTTLDHVSNKFGTRLGDGEYTYQIYCITSSGDDLLSKPRTFEVEVKEHSGPKYLYASAGSYYLIPIHTNWDGFQTTNETSMPHARVGDTIELYLTEDDTPFGKNTTIYLRSLLKDYVRSEHYLLYEIKIPKYASGKLYESEELLLDIDGDGKTDATLSYSLDKRRIQLRIH